MSLLCGYLKRLCPDSHMDSKNGKNVLHVSRVSVNVCNILHRSIKGLGVLTSAR